MTRRPRRPRARLDPDGTMVATVDGSCEVCGQVVVKGVDRIGRDSFGQWVHAGCR